MPIWNPVKDDPRYPALMTRWEELKTEQRALVDRMEGDFPADPQDAAARNKSE